MTQLVLGAAIGRVPDLPPPVVVPAEVGGIDGHATGEKLNLFLELFALGLGHFFVVAHNSFHKLP